MVFLQVIFRTIDELWQRKVLRPKVIRIHVEKIYSLLAMSLERSGENSMFKWNPIWFRKLNSTDYSFTTVHRSAPDSLRLPPIVEPALTAIPVLNKPVVSLKEKRWASGRSLDLRKRIFSPRQQSQTLMLPVARRFDLSISGIRYLNKLD